MRPLNPCTHGPRSTFADHTSQRPPTLTQLPPFAQAVAEVLAGQRDPGQLAFRMSGPTYRKLLRGVGLYRCHVRPRLRSAHLSRPASHVTEMSAVIMCGDRHRALALRIETVDHAWICTQLQTA